MVGGVVVVVEAESRRWQICLEVVGKGLACKAVIIDNCGLARLLAYPLSEASPSRLGKLWLNGSPQETARSVKLGSLITMQHLGS